VTELINATPSTQKTNSSGKAWEKWRLCPPPKGHPEVGKWVYEKYETLRSHRDRQGLVELWAHNHELLRGRIFKNKSKFSQVIANLFFKTHNAFQANLTDNKPRASIQANGETPDEFADVIQARYDDWWEFTKQQMCLQESVGRSELYGYQNDEMRYNPDLEGGLGDIETYRHDTYGVLYWPGYTDIQAQPGMCTYEAMELGKIYDLWPDVEGKVNPDAEYSDMLGESRQWVRATKSKNLRPEAAIPGYVVPEDSSLGVDARSGSGIQRAQVIKFWVKDYTMHWVNPLTGERAKKGDVFPTGQMQVVTDPETGEPLLDELGQPMMQPEALPAEEWSKYPGFIRCIIVTNKGKLVLDDVPNPSINPELPREITSQTYLWDKFPHLKRFSYSDDISEYGLSIFEQIETLIIEVCKKLTQYGVHLERTCRNPLLIPIGAMPDQKDVNNLPARVWPVVAGLAQYIRFLEVPQTPNDLLAYIELCIRLVDMITGITDVSEGRKPAGVQAFRAIAALQEKAQVQYRQKIRHNDAYLEEQGRMWISLLQNWDTEEKTSRVKGATKSFRGIDFQGEFAFKIEAGSTLPTNRAARQQQVIELAAARPNFPNQELLEELGIPNAPEIAEKMDAGPLGMALQKLEQSGLIDPETLQTIKNLIEMPENDFKRNFGSGNPLDIQGVGL
jgi:hypothetical protein